MIFDSAAMHNLRMRYANTSDYRAPRMVWLDRKEELAAEREYLERLIATVSQWKQREWMGRLISSDNAQHLGAWFEILLYGWLRRIGPVAVEPEVEDSYPDFLLTVAAEQIAVEARACLVDEGEREQSASWAEVLSALEEIELPFFVFLRKSDFARSVDIGYLTESVTNWLLSTPDVPCQFQDTLGTSLSLTATAHAGLGHVTVLRIISDWVMPDLLRAPLREKAKQHKGLRKAGYPYVLAILLESDRISAEDVVDAWFGRPQVTVDTESTSILHEGVDGSGLHFFGPELRHTTVSGTLVFRAVWQASSGRHGLKAWYIQNPYARRAIDPSIFPVDAHFLVSDRTATYLSMDWR